MRHRKAGVKLNRSSSHRKAMFRNMVTSLFKHDRIKTTDARAKEVSRWADHIITLAKRGDLHARRQALSIVREKDVVHKLFEEAKARFSQRNGGYTRIVKLGRRPGDAALISMIELIASDDQAKKKKKKKPAAKPAAPAKEAATDAAEALEADEAQDASAETAETDAADSEDTEAGQETAAPEAAADEAAEPEAEAADTADAAPLDEAEADEKKSE